MARLQDSLSIVEKNSISLQTNCLAVSEEIDEIYRRLNKALKDRTEHLRGEVDRYLSTELRNLTALKDNLDLEFTNIQSNCDLADKYINEDYDWDDCELMDTKEIFLKTVEFLRNYEYENTDYNRRVRFLMSIDPNQLVMNVATFGDLNITPHPTANAQAHLQIPNAGGGGLMRSKSDHRLASQFRQQEERGHGDDEPVLGGRKFGERQQNRYGDRYGRSGNDYDYDYETEPSSRNNKSRFRSRFVRSHQQDNDSDGEQSHHSRPEKDNKKERDRVIDTEDVARGHLSGIIRLTDSPRVMKRLQDQHREKKEKKEAPPPPQVQAKPAVVPKKTAAPPTAARQISEDEIDRIKRQNKGPTSSGQQAEAERPTSDRVTALKRSSGAGLEDSTNSPVRRTPPQVEVSSDEE